jgi:predicted RNA-binding protein with EMAP domain
MDYQTLFNLAITAAAFFGGWTLNRIYSAIDRLDNDVRNLPHEYVSKDDYRTDMKEIKEQLSKIIDKLDGKADK